MSMYNAYKTNNELEKKGVTVLFPAGNFRVTVARAGGANSHFARVLAAKAKPYRRAIATGSMTPEKELDLMIEVYAEAVVVNWEVGRVEGEQEVWQQGIEGLDGSVMPFSKDNVLRTLRALPDIFTDLQAAASSMDNFLEVRKDDAGN